MVAGDSAGKIRVFDAQGQLIRDIQYPAGGVFSLAASARLIVAGGADGRIVGWELGGSQ